MQGYNVFISHSWSYTGCYDRLIKLLNEAGNFSFKDYSVPRDDPIHNAPTDEKLKAAIQKQMSHASVVVVPAGIYATYSRWIKMEIHIAKTEFRVAKKILAVKPWGCERTSSLKDNADSIVGWNGQSIANSIKELAGS